MGKTDAVEDQTISCQALGLTKPSVSGRGRGGVSAVGRVLA